MTAQLIAHTVETNHGVVAGFLVREGGRDLGYIWSSGNAWRWKSPRGESYGERSSKPAAIATLRDLAQVRAGAIRVTIAPPVPERRPSAPAYRSAPAPRAVSPAAPEAPQRPDPEPPRQAIKWADVDGASVTEALNRAWRTR